MSQERGDALDRLSARKRERCVIGHIDGDPQRGLRAALADPALEHPEPARLDRELDVAQVRVVPLQTRGVGAELGGDRRQTLVEHRDRLRLVAARHDVLTLGVEQDVAVQSRLAGCRIAREEHAGGRGRATIAEDHGLDRHRGAEVVGDPLLLPIGAGPIAVPGAEDGLHRQPQLLPWILRRVDADDGGKARLEALATAGSERLAAGGAGQTRLLSHRSGRGSGSCPSCRASRRGRRIGR